jgi:hypothetical protein
VIGRITDTGERIQRRRSGERDTESEGEREKRAVVRRNGEGRRRGKREKKKEIRGEIRSLESRGADQRKGGPKDPQRRKERDERGGKRGEVAEGGDD